MLCPYCLEIQDLHPDTDPDRGPILKCPNEACAGYTIPLQYAADHATYPPLPVSIIGLPGHGKSVYIDSLIQEINQLGARWDDSNFYYSWLDEVQMRQAMARLKALREGQLPEITRTVFQQPQVLRLDHIPRIGGCQLIIFDTGGEAFLDTAVMADAAKYVRNSTAVVMLLSIKADEEQGGPDLINAMMTVYLQSMSQTGGRTQEQNLIVVLTKGDELVDRPDIPESARDALSAPNYSPASSIWDSLQQSSDDLERWLRSEYCGYHNFVNLVRSRFKAVRYCLVSAQGQAADENGIIYQIMPRGVIAPLLWLWRLQYAPVWVEAEDGGRELYLDFADAVANAGGRTIRLEGQRYLINRPIKVTSPLTIVGAGKGKTILLLGGAKCGLEITLPNKDDTPKKPVTLRGLTVRRFGVHPGDVIRLLHGGLRLAECAVTGGKAGELGEETCQGHGLRLTSEAQLAVAGTDFTKNSGIGLLLQGGSSTKVEGCTFTDNGMAGVHLATTARAAVRGSTFRANKVGIKIEQAQSTTIEGNSCEQNTENGILVKGSVGSDVKLRNNRCSGNAKSGVVVRDRAAPLVDGNVCEKNGGDGLAFLDTSGGTASGNRLTGNAISGLRVADQSDPTVENNVATGNVANGIVVTHTAAGSVRQNECSNNRGDGIRVEGVGEVVLANNTATDNAGHGVAILKAESKAKFTPTADQLKGNRKGPVRDERPKTGGWFRK